jgi:hypothetical protein
LRDLGVAVKDVAGLLDMFVGREADRVMRRSQEIFGRLAQAASLAAPRPDAV